WLRAHSLRHVPEPVGDRLSVRCSFFAYQWKEVVWRVEREKSNSMLCVDQRTSNSSSQEGTVKSHTGRFIMVVTICLGLMIPLNVALAEPKVFSPDSAPFNKNFQEWSAEWWQFVFSIPQKVNPLLDEDGDDCMVGQYGPVWFLMGTLA